MDRLTAHRRVLLYVCAFLMDLGAFCGFSMVFLLLKHDLNAPLATQGLLPLANSVVYLLLCPVMSRLSRDRRGVRIGFFIAGPLVMALAYWLIGRAGTVWQLGGLMGLSATAMALYWPQLEAEIGHGASGKTLGRRMGLFNLSWSVGSTIAPALGGWLFAQGHRLPFFAATAIGLLIAGVATAYLLLRIRAGETRAHLKSGTGAVSEGSLGPVGSITPQSAIRNPQSAIPVMPVLLVAFVWLAWFGNFVAFANQGVARSLFQNLGVVLEYSAPQIGLLMAMLGVVRTAAFAVLQGTHAWAYRSRYLFIFQGLMLAGMVFLCVPGTVWVAAAAMGLIGLGSAMAYTASMFYSVEGAHYGKASTGLHESVLGAGGALGVLLAGQVAPRLFPGHARSPFYACVALTVVCFAIQAVVFALYRRRRRAAAPP